MHPDASEVWVAGRIANYFESGYRFEGMSGALPTWMVELSLDGFLALIQAFGVQLQPHQKVVNASVAKMPGEFWRGVCCRAVQRLSDYTVSKDTKQLSPWIWEGGLESLALSFVRHADQQVAIKLLRDVFGTEVLARFGSQRTALCQMPLFEE